MGTLHQEQQNKQLINDLKVTLQDSTLIFPSKPTIKKTMFLSNIDQVLNFNVQTVHFFSPNSSFPPKTVAEKLKNALSKVIVSYDFLAGRLKTNPESGRFEFDCNDAGAVFVEASSDYSLEEIGDLVYPNPAFAQLIVETLDSKLNLPQGDKPLCIIQVTSFTCGGFAIGVATSHATFDGISFKTFLQNLASQAFDDDDHHKPLAVVPCNDRHLLAARSPPRVTFPHPELLKLKLPIGEEANAPVFDCAEEESIAYKVFRLSSQNINFLKKKAQPEPSAAGNKPPTTYKITGFNVVSAHIWRCKALSCDVENNSERESTLLYAVDIRPRLAPPLPASYVGNAVLTAYATAKCKELEEGPFCKLVEMVSEGSARMTDEYARSAIDWGELYKGFPHGEFLISSWWRLGFAEVEYPWGKPKYSCPVVTHRKDIILLFPEIEGISSNGVNVLVALPGKEMQKFESFFHKFLA